jgi:hypothetical protein
MGAREARIARNEARFRAANERIVGQRDRLEFDRSDRTPFLCECGDPDCVRVMTLTLDEYERVRADPHTFAVIPGHEDAATESVASIGAADGEGFVTVRKRPEVRAHSGAPDAAG